MPELEPGSGEEQNHIKGQGLTIETEGTPSETRTVTLWHGNHANKIYRYFNKLQVMKSGGIELT